MHAVRKATKADVPRLKGVLGRSFQDDPVNTWLIGSELRKLERFFEVYELGTRLAETYTTDGLDGAAIWTAPGQWKMSWRTTLSVAPTMLRLTGRRTLLGAQVEKLLDENHPREPHWYLAVLGTDPEKQGRGVGSAVMAPVLDLCDRDGVGAYLESSKEKNVPFYRRHGFEVTKELRLPKGGPSLWLMWRDPRPPS